jgi:excisionase family DNA binding protein
MKNKKEVQLLSVREAATGSGYQPATVRTWANERRFPHVRVGRVIRIPVDAWDAFIREHTIPASGGK